MAKKSSKIDQMYQEEMESRFTSNGNLRTRETAQENSVLDDFQDLTSKLDDLYEDHTEKIDDIVLAILDFVHTKLESGDDITDEIAAKIIEISEAINNNSY